MDNIKNKVTLVVSSCDIYEDSWRPYFELIKKYWRGRPEKIALITETKSYSCDGLDISVYNTPHSESTWSERLYSCLEKLDTEYIVFSLEDFFLLDYVDDVALEQCYEWMEEDKNIAVCRLYSSDLKELVPTEKYGDFRIAGSNTSYRLDTQAALWRREVLMSFIDLKENPWQFEGNGTERIKASDKLFLWHFSESLDDISNRVFPYQILQKYGYGIAWRHWLWNNKAWFEKNGIYKVRYGRLGALSKKAVYRRMNHLYNKNKTPFEKMITPFWQLGIKLRKVVINVFTLGFIKGFKRSWKMR